MTTSSLSKAWFIASIAVLAFFYGYASHAWGWFPHTYVQQAWKEANRTILDAASVSLRPFGYERDGWRTLRPDEMQPGMTLITSSWRPSEAWTVGLKLFDDNGDVVHQWFIDRDSLFDGDLDQRYALNEKDIHGSVLLEDGDVVFNIEYVGMARVNACGDVVWSLTEGNHHSVARAEDGSFWVPGVSQEQRAGSDRYPDGYPGLRGKKIWQDRILNVGRDGEILRDIPVLDILYANGLERYIPKTLGGKRPTPEQISADVTHLNDIEPLPSDLADEYPLFEAGDLMVSLRSLSLVFVFDPETMEVRWHASEPFIYQHDPDFVGNGWIGVFDNNYDLTPYDKPDERGTMLGGNRIVGIQPHTKSTELWFPKPGSDHVYTHVRGKWQQLANGNFLLTEASAGRALEVNAEGQTVWEWIHRPTSDWMVPSVSKAIRHDLTRRQVENWPCTSTSD